MLSIIVFIHEGGHFITARLMKIRVKEFMIGLPGPSIGFKRGRTRYGVTAIPLGGYCQIAGEGGKESPHLAEAYTFLAYYGRITTDDADLVRESLGFDLVEALDTLASWMTIAAVKLEAGKKRYEMLEVTIEDMRYPQGCPRPVSSIAAARDHISEERKHTYNGLPWWRRLVVLFGGSIFNLIFAIAVITAVLVGVGTSAPTTIINEISPGSPAEQAGLVSGDTLVSVDGATTSSWTEFTARVLEKQVGDVITLEYLHEGTPTTAEITLANNQGRPIVGVIPTVENQPIAFPDALLTAVSFIGLVVQAILQLFNPATFTETISQSSSVIGIAVEASNAASYGILNFIILAAQISISIGLMNLLPIPPLDGGKIVIETIQRITRRIVPARIVGGISITVLVLFIVLFVVLTNQDIHRYFLGG